VGRSIDFYGNKLGLTVEINKAPQFAMIRVGGATGGTIGLLVHAPVAPLSSGPPTMAVLPSADSETEVPCSAPKGPATPVPTNFDPCWVQTPLLRLKTHAAPTLQPQLLS
jgi:hypothetical protein